MIGKIMMNEVRLIVNGNVVKPLTSELSVERREYDDVKISSRISYNDFCNAIRRPVDTNHSTPKNTLSIKQVVFNPPATIVIWSDGSKTVVKAENEPFDKEKGLAMAICKRTSGNKGNYFEVFKKYCHEECEPDLANVEPVTLKSMGNSTVETIKALCDSLRVNKEKETTTEKD